MAPLEVNYDESVNNSRDLVEDRKWQKLFPKCVADRERSSIFMTRALYVAFSMILQKRGILDKDCFTKNYITENLKCATLSFKNAKGLAITHQLKAAGESIRRGYLKEFSLVLSEKENDDEAFEVYAFKFHYYENGGVAAEMTSNRGSGEKTPMENLIATSYEGTGSVRNQLIMLVRSISYLCQKLLGPLPSNYSANFRVHYTEEAPEDFKIEGFENSKTFYNLPDDIQSAALGHVRPGHHGGIMECLSIHMNDAYEAELALKRHMEKVLDALGFEQNTTFYSTFETEDRPQNVTQTRSDAIPAESPEANGNVTVEILADQLETTMVESDKSETVESPKAIRITRRGAAASQAAKSGKSSPYSKPTRSRK